MPVPTPEEVERRRRVNVGIETVSNVTSTDFPGHWPGEDHSWNIEHFKKNFNVTFHTNAPLDSSFSLTGLDASLANAFRRILLSELPTFAIEDVYIMNNTSIIQDEVLAHRLGLIPLRGDPKGLRWMKWYRKTGEDDQPLPPTDYNCLVLELKIECKWQDGGLQRAVQGETDPDKLYINHSVYARDLQWIPQGQQVDQFAADKPIQSTNPNILIAKMRPGQLMNITMHAVKGIGADHAKFSPVATASYRLLPTIDILKPITGADAKKFARCFPKGVIALEEITDDDKEKHSELVETSDTIKAVVKDPMRDTVSRECLRHAEFKDKVKLGRVRDHFIFRVESTGQQESDELFLDSVRLLKIKAARVKRGLDLLNR